MGQTFWSPAFIAISQYHPPPPPCAPPFHGILKDFVRQGSSRFLDGSPGTSRALVERLGCLDKGTFHLLSVVLLLLQAPLDSFTATSFEHYKHHVNCRYHVRLFQPAFRCGLCTQALLRKTFALATRRRSEEPRILCKDSALQQPASLAMRAS